ncbi:MAG: sigma-54 dependent transcriptional regulator [Gemmatimonadota bacterium]
MGECILVVEDDTALRELLVDVLAAAEYAAVGFAQGDRALEYLATASADLVITDLVMPGIPGEELLSTLRKQWPAMHVIVLTAFGTIDSAIELVKGGAFDYLTKPVGTDDLLLSVERALTESRLRREVARLSREQSGVLPAGMIGASRPMHELASLIGRTAVSSHGVLITGESGTGKELVARALHQLSGRKNFVAVNCAALPEQLLESELFGHERGAFTGADQQRNGLFHSADHGTLFLDEVAELPLRLQPKLLRALESGEIRRIGSSQITMVNARILAATNRDLAAEVEEGRFREDLYWRLNVLHLEVPPLRERPADVILLAEHFLAADMPGHRKTLASDTVAVLGAYPWPGNVRELRNAIQRAMTLSSGDTIRPDDLPPRICGQAGVATILRSARTSKLSLRELERIYVLDVLREAGGNKSRAAEILGLDRKTLYRKLQEYNEEVSSP